MKLGRKPSPKKQQASVLNVSSWMMAGSANVRTTMPAFGDWYVNPKKFPNGLKPLIDKVHSLGMDFGLWVEPEMVNPDSDLYRKHPDWVLDFS
jgi:alpha-glucosidase (family GH31 glycosyl hydrolase)